MKKLWIIGFIIILLTSTGFAQVGFEGRPITNNLMMPTGHTLNRGEFIIGIGSIGFGITDNIQVGTNILLFLFQDYNARLKVSFIKTKTLAMAGGIRIDYFNLSVFTEDEDDASFMFLSPYFVVSPKVGPKTTAHFGAQYSIISSDFDIEDAEAESFTEGTSIYAGLDYSMSHKTKFLVEGGYDVTWEGLRFGGGILFGWEKFRLKLGVNYFKPKDFDALTLPVIGLWWRFKG